MTKDLFSQWVDKYGNGWVTQNVDASLSLFTDDATYMYTPLHPVMRGKREIEGYIRKAEGLQSDIKFSYAMLAIQEPFAICRWKASLIWNATGSTIRFDGIYHFYLNQDGLCYRFDEWWHSDPPYSEESAPTIQEHVS